MDKVQKPIPARSARTRLGRKGRPAGEIVHSSIYLPAAVHQALRKVAFDEHCKIHDLIIEGIEAALRKRGYPGGNVKDTKRR